MINDDLKGLFAQIIDNPEERLYKQIFGDCLRENKELSPEYEVWANIIDCMNDEKYNGHAWRAYDKLSDPRMNRIHQLIKNYCFMMGVRSGEYVWERGFITQWIGYFSDVDARMAKVITCHPNVKLIFKTLYRPGTFRLGDGVFYEDAKGPARFWFMNYEKHILFPKRTLAEAQRILAEEFSVKTENIIFEDAYNDLQLEG